MRQNTPDSIRTVRGLLHHLKNLRHRNRKLLRIIASKTDTKAALGIQISQQHFLSPVCQSGSQAQYDRTFGYSAFLVDYAQFLCHLSSPLSFLRTFPPGSPVQTALPVQTRIFPSLVPGSCSGFPGASASIPADTGKSFSVPSDSCSCSTSSLPGLCSGKWNQPPSPYYRKQLHPEDALPPEPEAPWKDCPLQSCSLQHISYQPPASPTCGKQSALPCPQILGLSRPDMDTDALCLLCSDCFYTAFISLTETGFCRMVLLLSLKPHKQFRMYPGAFPVSLHFHHGI